MDKNILASNIEALMPDRPQGINDLLSDDRASAIDSTATAITKKAAAAELARMRIREQKKLDYLGSTAKPVAEGAVSCQEEKLEAIKTAEAVLTDSQSSLSSALDSIQPTSLSTTQKMLLAEASLSTSRKDVDNLLSSLNINLNLRLNKRDMSKLLACLMTCNEMQLEALANNSRVPVAIKTVIRRMQEDMKHGNIGTLERLWDRVFGAQGMVDDGAGPAAKVQPGVPALQDGSVLPGAPVSREAYIILRDTIIK